MVNLALCCLLVVYLEMRIPQLLATATRPGLNDGVHEQSATWEGLAPPVGLSHAPTAHAERDAWGRVIERHESSDRVSFRSRGADGVAYTGDDLVSLVTKHGRGHMLIAPSLGRDARTDATRNMLDELATETQRTMAAEPVRQAPQAETARSAAEPAEQTHGRWVAGAAQRMRTQGDRAVEMLRDAAQPGLVSRIPTGPDENLSGRLDVVRTVMDMGAAHREMKAIARILQAGYAGHWPDDFRGQSYVPPDETGVDPWGAPYRYQQEHLSFRLESAGPDGVWNTADDPALLVHQRGVMDFQPHWDAGPMTLALNAMTGQLDPQTF